MNLLDLSRLHAAETMQRLTQLGAHGADNPQLTQARCDIIDPIAAYTIALLAQRGLIFPETPENSR